MLCIAKVLEMVARVFLKYPEWLLGCYYAVARVPREVVKVLLCG